MQFTENNSSTDNINSLEEEMTQTPTFSYLNNACEDSIMPFIGTDNKHQSLSLSLTSSSSKAIMLSFNNCGTHHDQSGTRHEQSGSFYVIHMDMGQLLGIENILHDEMIKKVLKTKPTVLDIHVEEREISR